MQTQTRAHTNISQKLPSKVGYRDTATSIDTNTQTYTHTQDKTT